jgi:hypothetical protein
MRKSDGGWVRKKNRPSRERGPVGYAEMSLVSYTQVHHARTRRSVSPFEEAHMLMRQTLVAAKFDIVYKYLDEASSRVKDERPRLRCFAVELTTLPPGSC